MAIQFYIADTETTGLNTKMHEIFEISCIRAKDRVQLSQRIKVEKPQLASYDALRITGNTVSDLSLGITKLQAINEFEEFVKEDGVESTHRCLVLHNASFDRKFLLSMWERFNRKFPFDLYLDTISMHKDYLRKQGIVKASSKLTDACDMLGVIKKGTSHNAKYDTRHTYLLWDKLSKTIDFMDHIKRLPHILPGDETEDGGY